METVIQYWWLIIPLAFVVVLLYAFNPRRKREFEDDADIPFRDDK
jgi:cbb3-type cytochrome oxidase subunit 3